MVLLATTPTILHAVASLPADSTLKSETSLPSSLDTPISHITLIRLSKCLSPSYTLNSLLRGTKPYTPPPPPKPQQSEEYHALMARLRADQERREYRALLEKQEAGSQQALSGQLDDQEQEQEKDDISPSLVFNILLSVVMCAAVAFHLTRWWPSDGLRVLVSLGTALVVGVAEVTVYAAYLRKVDESRRQERRKKERKEVIGPFTGDESGADAGGEMQEVDKIEIWARGVHGGARRRVRDQWRQSQQMQEQSHSDFPRQ